MKFAFYYRTRNEYHEVQNYVDKLNAEMEENHRIRNRTLLRMHTRYQTKDKVDNWVWDSKVPKERVGTKKYIGIVLANCHLLKRCDVQPDKFLQELGREVVPKIAGVSKYDGTKSVHPVMIKTHRELRKISSVFNKRYGHGNWRFSGPKGLQEKLRQIEPRDGLSFTIGDFRRDMLLEKYPNGIPVKLVVYEKDANIPKQLFKVVLKG